jgi:nitroimidazol reductase NimA-like FMN-containing flavoprotein (pyridoxamine 5'-phosphate oxidase superfamily)
MTREEVFERLASTHTGIVTTLRRDGMPMSTPVWFVIYAGAVCFGTPSKSRKAARLRRDSKVGFLVEGGKRWAELWAIHLTGHATLIDDVAEQEAVAALQAEKYAGFSTPRSEYPEDSRRFYESDTVRLIYRIDAEDRIVSWDNTKLGLA